MAYAPRKFFDLHVANKSQLAEQALHSIGGLYDVERQARDMSNEERWRIRQEMVVAISKTLHDWMLAQRDLGPMGQPRPKPSNTAPSTTTRSRARYGHGHSDARTGC